MDLIEAINSRVSAVRLTEPGPTDAQMDVILNAAVRAPDHRRLAPWRLVVIEGKAREKLGQAYVDLKRRLNPEQPNLDMDTEFAKAFRAPTIVAVGAAIDDTSKVPVIEQKIAVAAAVENMFLAAHSLGLGVMWKTGDLAYDPNFKKMIGLKSDDSIIALLFIGTHVKVPKARAPQVVGRATWL